MSELSGWMLGFGMGMFVLDIAIINGYTFYSGYNLLVDLVIILFGAIMIWSDRQ